MKYLFSNYMIVYRHKGVNITALPVVVFKYLPFFIKVMIAKHIAKKVTKIHNCRMFMILDI